MIEFMVFNLFAFRLSPMIEQGVGNPISVEIHWRSPALAGGAVWRGSVAGISGGKISEGAKQGYG